MEVIRDKEVNKRNRQCMVFKEYFDKRREVYDVRLVKFLKMYPYSDVGAKSGILNHFEDVVRGADLLQKNAIFQAFQQEKDYWNSVYVINKCDVTTHAHIVDALKGMEKTLTSLGYSYINQTISDHQFCVSGQSLSKSIRTSDPFERNTPDNNHWGRVGEEAVDYVLKWLPDLYLVIKKDCQGKYGDNVIILENDSFVDESQEFDHLVIGPQGIFNIETKNYTGKLSIDQNGNWYRLKKGEAEWVAEENPAQQLFRHHVLLQSIVGDDVPIINVICMAHPNLMISDQGNSLIPVVKKDLLADFIVNYKPAGLNVGDIENLRTKIEAYKVDK